MSPLTAERKTELRAEIAALPPYRGTWLGKTATVPYILAALESGLTRLLVETEDDGPTATDFARLGWQVLPAADGAKIPDRPGWSKDGKSQPVGLTPEQLLNRRDQDYLDRYCVITGPVSGIFDLETDVDKKTCEKVGEASLAARPALPRGPRMETASGSVHRIFRYPDLPGGQKVVTRRGVLPGADVRGDGGQFLALEDGARVWQDFDLPLPEAPGWLLDLVTGTAREKGTVPSGPAYQGPGAGTDRATRYLAQQCDRIAGAVEGERNSTFHRAVYGVAGLVAGGSLDRATALADLEAAGEVGEVEELPSVMRSSWAAGEASPWVLEDAGAPRVPEYDEDGREVHPLAVRRPDAPASANPAGQRYGASVTHNREFTLGLSDLEAIPPPKWLIPGRLQTGCLAQLTGPSGSYKTFLALGWALSLATPNPVVAAIGGKDQSYRVLYLAGEGAGGLAARVRAWEVHTGRRYDPARLRFRTDVPSLLEPEPLAEYCGIVRDSGPWDLVIIDTLSRAIPGGDENAQDVMSRAVEAAYQIQGAARGRDWDRTVRALRDGEPDPVATSGQGTPTVLVVHHMGWSGTRQRGSSVLYSACDNVCYLVPRDVEKYAGEVWLRTPKVKDGEAGRPELLSFQAAGNSGLLLPGGSGAGDEDTGTREQDQRERVAERLEKLRRANPLVSKRGILQGFDGKDRKLAAELWDADEEPLIDPDETDGVAV